MKNGNWPRLVVAALCLMVMPLIGFTQTKVIEYEFSYPELLGRKAGEVDAYVTLSGHFSPGFGCSKYESYNKSADTTLLYRSADLKLSEGILFVAFLFDGEDRCVGECFGYEPGRKSELYTTNKEAFGNPRYVSGGKIYWGIGNGVRCHLFDGSDCWGQGATIIYLDKP
jgi:hypothetical protein